MISYTKLNVYNIILIITIAIFIFLNLLINNILNLINSETIDYKDNVSQTKELESEVVTEEEHWSIEIPVINLKANIAEGTTEKVMNKYVGHFENTAIWDGNVGLAAHNRRLSSKLFWKT